MRNRLLLLLIVMAVAGCVPGRAEVWTKGKLVLSGQSFDHYRVYKVYVDLGGDKAAIIWNFSGSFRNVCGGAARCEAASRVIDFMLTECKASPADMCMSEIPISFTVRACAGVYPCIGLAFPKDPLKDQARKTVKAFFASDDGTMIRSKEEIAGELPNACVSAKRETSCPKLESPDTAP